MQGSSTATAPFMLALVSIIWSAQSTPKVSRRQVGPLSEVTGTTALIDSIISPGQPRSQTKQIDSTSTSSGRVNSPFVADLSKVTRVLAATDKPETGYSSATCALSFDRRALDENTDNGRASLSRRSATPELLDDNERSALFMTEAAQACVDAMRARACDQAEPFGVVICYSVGYIDQSRSMIGGQVTVFRLGGVTELRDRSGMDLEDLSSGIQLQLAFGPTDPKQHHGRFSQSSLKGALRLSQPAWAPIDDPDHLINPSNAHFTASCGKTEMVLIGTFHLNLGEDLHLKSSGVRKRGVVTDLSNLVPAAARLTGRGTHDLDTHFFDLSNQLERRSRLVGSEAWGLFKRQSPDAPLSDVTNFRSDAACVTAGLNVNPFFVGDEQQPPLVENLGQQQQPQPPVPRVNTFPAAPIAPQPQEPTPPNEPPPQTENQPSPEPPPNTTVISDAPLNTSVDVNPSTLEASINTDVTGANSIVAAAAAIATPIPFQLPGRTLEVTPIGLAIFVTLSSITLIFVGIVTYERKKYRDQFRQRKMQEQVAKAAGLDMAEAGV